MNVLLVSEPGVDGVFRYVESLCHHLIGGGVRVHLAYSDRRGSDRLPLLVATVEGAGGRTVNLRTGNRPGPADLPALAALLRLARAVRPDVIHAHSSKAGALARALPLFGVRAAYLYTPHAYFGMKPRRGRLDFLYDAAERVLGRVGHTVVVSSSERDFGRVRLGIDGRRMRTLPNGVDTDTFSPASPERRRDLRASFGLPPGRILGFMGRSSAQKDPVTLYRAFAQAAEGRDLALFHVGRGELDGRLEELVRELGLEGRVFRRPYLSTPVDFYRAVDGFILTSQYEGFSLAALEALSCNLPLILSVAPGNQDLLAEPLSHAWSARPGDVAGFAQAIAEWCDRPADPAAVNHREVARLRHDRNEKLEAVVSLYRELLRAPRHLRALHAAPR